MSTTLEHTQWFASVELCDQSQSAHSYGVNARAGTRNVGHDPWVRYAAHKPFNSQWAGTVVSSEGEDTQTSFFLRELHSMRGRADGQHEKGNRASGRAMKLGILRGRMEWARSAPSWCPILWNRAICFHEWGQKEGSLPFQWFVLAPNATERTFRPVGSR